MMELQVPSSPSQSDAEMMSMSMRMAIPSSTAAAKPSPYAAFTCAARLMPAGAAAHRLRQWRGNNLHTCRRALRRAPCTWCQLCCTGCPASWRSCSASSLLYLAAVADMLMVQCSTASICSGQGMATQAQRVWQQQMYGM
jgi:hypothetical protein